MPAKEELEVSIQELKATLSGQRQAIFERLGYVPNPSQRPIHDSEARIKLIAGGERSGKSTVSEKELISRCFEGKLFWLVGVEYQTTKEEFKFICDDLDILVGPEGYKATTRVDPGEIKVPSLGFRVVTKSARDPRKLGMEAPDGILGCEAAQLDFETFLRLQGRAAEKRAWIVLSGTFEGSLGWYPEYYTRWQAPNEDDSESFSIPTWSNVAVFHGGEKDPEILRLKAASSIEWFSERYGGVPCPPAGRVFNEFSNKIHTSPDYNFEAALPVYLWVDPGYAFAYAVEVVQKHGDDVYVIDEIYERGLVTSDIIKICKQKSWWNKVIGGAVDIAATQHQAMPPVIEIWRKESGINLHLGSKRVRIPDGIEQVKRYLLVNPVTNHSLLHINTKCKGLISELGGCPNPITGRTAVYRWKQDKDGTVIGDAPEDTNNHACKALAYGLIDLFGYTAARQQRPKIKFW